LRGKKALLPLVFVLFLALPAANINEIKHTENSNFAAGDLTTNPTKEEIKLIDNGEYKDGLIDNFDYFVNSGYPLCYTQTVENAGSG
jgi:hypothetical protein